MQGTLNLPWSTSTLVRMLPVAKKQPLPTTNVSGSVTCREQTRKLPNYKMCSSSLWLQDCVSVNACGHFEKKLKEYEDGVVDYIYSFRLATAGGNEIMLLQVPLQNPEPASPWHIRVQRWHHTSE